MPRRKHSPGSLFFALSVLLCWLLPTTATGSLPPIASSLPPITGSSSSSAHTTTHVPVHHHQPRLLQPPQQPPAEDDVVVTAVVSQDVVLAPGSLASGELFTTDQVTRLAQELATLAAVVLLDDTNTDDDDNNSNSVACDVQSQRDVGNDSVSVRALEFACTYPTSSSSGSAQRFVDTINDNLDDLTEAWQSASEEGLDEVIFQALPMVLVSSSTSIPAATSTSAPTTTTPVAAPPTGAPASSTAAATNSPQQQQQQVANSEPTAAPATADSVVVVTAVYVQEFQVAPTADLWTAQEQGQFASLMARYSRNVGANNTIETECHIVHHILILDTANTAMLMVEYECDYQSLSSSLPSESTSMDLSTLPLRFVTTVNGNLLQVAIDLQALGLEDVALAHPVVLQTMTTNSASSPTDDAPPSSVPGMPPTSAARGPSSCVSTVLVTGIIACLLTMEVV